ncbi:S-methyl-5'-thioadenosine phosphorylase [Salvelinus sp. IW2-2015]|uniref:S-methyl-5'-thioadenosine phosphorylase n=1 Tax=Salvelinus sp. IW2-2015 TaxID=2691554 RepID=UPI0038D48C22
MSASMQIKIGIIGGSGLDDPDILEGRTEKYVDTPYGKPSDALIMGKIKNVECVLLARHGRQHTIMPTDVNYQANIWALREEGCTHLLVTTACGSLREEIQPGDIVIIDQFIDRCTIESILSGCITAWYNNCTALNCKALQRVVRFAQLITRDSENISPNLGAAQEPASNE